MSGGGRSGARAAVKMEAAPFYAEEGLELLPDFAQLPGFGAAGLEAAEESGAEPHKLLLAAKKPPPPRDLAGAAAPSAAPPPSGPFPSLRPGPGALQPLLKLPAAADLEQLLLQAAGPVPPSPAAAAAGGAPFLYRPPPPPPAPVTQEQEGFADGFVKALADLHKQNQLLGAPPSPAPHPAGPCCPPPRPDPAAVYTTLGAFEPAAPPPAAAFFARLPAPPATDEPQTVPEAPPPAPAAAAAALSSGDSPPPPSALSPLDAESQERLKAERKRLRNRIAASKCRRRKLERIARLEEKVKALKGQNAELAATAGLLRAQVSQLQGRVRSHLSSGCHINAAPGPTPGGEGAAEPQTSAC
uniref:transcription factor JunD-like n=1 Tax=Euleptes europaea TaxID=460621 RepID=UPI002540C688|nr:transcription factor JunD-like [Euleptes europaea]